MYQLTTELADDLRRQRLADAARQRLAQRLLTFRRATRRTGRRAARAVIRCAPVDPGSGCGD
jgi:hypothetical protein